MAFKFVNNSISLPNLYPTVTRKLPTVKDKNGWAQVGDFKLRNSVDLIPQPGLQENLCACEANLVFICGAATSGKAQPYDAKVLTPRGFVEMGSLRVGDTITGSNGKPQTILRIFEQGERDVCELKFADGSVVECDYEHLWNVTATRAKCSHINTILTTNQIIEELKGRGVDYGSIRNIYVPLPNPIEFDCNENLPLSPYLLGAILGDGCTRIKDCKPRIYTPDTEILDRIRADGYDVKRIPSSDCGWTFENHSVKDSLVTLGLWNCLSYDKFVPDAYLKASVYDRLALLQGLLDTDGSVSYKSLAEYSTSSCKLATQVRDLVFSLGGYCYMSARIPKYTYNGNKKDGHKSYRLFISFANQQQAFSISRKKDKCTTQRNTRYCNGRRIVDYKYIGKKQCRCLLVSNPDHLYITNDYIVTHNTFGMYMTALYGVDKNGFTSILFSFREKDSKKGSSIFRDGVEVLGKMKGCEYASSDNISFRFPKSNSQLQLANFNYNVANPTEWSDFKEDMKKKQASLIMVDEATKMQEKALLYIFSRNRDGSGMQPQMICSFNPENEHFTTDVIKAAGFLDSGWHVRKEMEGRLIYFFMKGKSFKDAVWGLTPEDVAARAGIEISQKDREAGLTEADMVKSFTVFTGEASENRILVAITGGQSVANLYAVGKEQSDILKRAYFGPIQKEDINVSKQMILQLWENPIDDDENMYATLDVSGGSLESDNTPMVIWRGSQVIDIKFFRGDSKQLVDWIDAMLNTYNIPVENFAYDATGIGYYLRAYTSGRPITANKRCLQEYDSNGNPVQIDEYFNLRSQLLGKTEVMLKKGEISFAIDQNSVIPYGKNGQSRRLIDVLSDEIAVFSTSTRNKKIYYRSKDEYKAKYGSSPDLIDAISYKAVFMLDTRGRKQPATVNSDEAYNALWSGYAPRSVGRGWW
jgi:hypothetical protein